ncbi:MAG: VWA domain-containing protein, partial [Pseudomonadota bacterium]
AMAGPSWREVPQPLWQDRTPLVIAVDLSYATFADDVPPSRLLQARAKIARILEARGGGQIALVAFADDAYTVSPLTGDAANVALFVDALSPEVMPSDGSRADRAIEESVRLLERAGFPRGDILLITDRAGGGANGAAIDARSEGYRVSVLGLGAVSGGRYRDRDGAPAVARLHDGDLGTLAASGGGRYVAFAPGDADLRALGVLDADRIDTATVQDKRGAARLDEGFWLLPPLLLLALLAFRRGVLAVVLLTLWLPLRPADAAELWRREDQRQHAEMARGVEAYRNGDYAAAEAAWRDLPGAEAAYNRGNALAKQGRYDEAIAEYDHALRLRPDLADAAENRNRVDAARRREQARREQRGGEDGDRKRGSQEEQSGRQDKAQGERRDPQQDAQRGARSDPSRDRSQPPSAAQQGAAPKPRPDASQDPKAQAREQREAEAAQRERMRRAVAGTAADPGKEGGRRDAVRFDPKGRPGETAAERERRIANEAWLRRVPDDPGGLLRAKFILEQKRRRREGDR